MRLTATLLTFAIAFAALFLQGCGGGEAKEQSQPPKAPQSTQIEAPPTPPA